MQTISNAKTEKSVVNESILDDSIEAEDLFLMANLRQKTTGLPMVIWVSERGDAKHGARIKVATSHSEKINIHETVSVSIAQPPQLVAGEGLSNQDFQWVAEFITLNKSLLLEYWHSEIDTSDLIMGLVKLPTAKN